MRQNLQIPHQLLLDLMQLYPRRGPDPKKTDAENWLYEGKLALIDDLVARVQRQDKVRLETTRVFRITPESTPRSGGSPDPASS
jgi:hypothetical protein